MKFLYLLISMAALGASVGSSYSFNEFYTKGSIITNSDDFLTHYNSPFSNNVEMEIISVQNNDGVLNCIDVWQVFNGPINGGEIGRVCVVNGSYFCDITYYRLIDRMGSGECHMTVE